jgi:hypothetical protein
MEFCQRHVLAAAEPDLSSIRKMLEEAALWERRAQPGSLASSTRSEYGPAFEVTHDTMRVGLIDPLNHGQQFGTNWTAPGLSAGSAVSVVACLSYCC